MADQHEPVGIAAVYRDDPRLEPLIGPGGPFEVEEVELDGVPLRVFVRAPRTIVDTFDMGVAHAELVAPRPRRRAPDLRRRARPVTRAGARSCSRRSASARATGSRSRCATCPSSSSAFWGAALARRDRRAAELVVDGRRARPTRCEDAGAKVAFLDDERRRPRRRRTDAPPACSSSACAPSARRRRAVRRPGARRPAGRRRRRASSIPTIRSRSSTRRARPGGRRARSAPTAATSPTSGTWPSARAREALIAGRHPRPTVQPASLSAAPAVPHRRHRRHHRQPDGRLEDRPHAQVGPRSGRSGSRVDEGLTGVRRRARHRPPDPRAPGRRGARPRRPRLPDGRRRRPARPPHRGACRCFGESIQLLNGYGLTETTSAVVTNVGVEFVAHPDSVGRPNLTADLQRRRRRRATSSASARSASCAFRSPQVVKGYWNDDGGDEAVVRRRLVPLRRPRLRRRRRLRVRGRPHQGRRDPRRGERLLRRGRGGAPRAPRRRRRRGRRPRRAGDGRAGVRGRRAPARTRSVDLRRPADVRLDTARRVQVPRGAAPDRRAPRTATEKVAKPELRARISDAADVDTLW